MALALIVKKFHDIPLIHLDGRVIGVDSKKLKKKLESVYKKETNQIILDITRTDFMDSTGLGIILYYHTLMQKSGRELILLTENDNPQAYMNRLLEFTKLTTVLKVITSLESLL